MNEEEQAPSLHAQVVGGAHLREGWDALATMLSAMLLFGLPAWWLGRALGVAWLVGVGLVLGMTAAVLLVWFRYGVPAHDASDRAGRRRLVAGTPRATADDREDPV